MFLFQIGTFALRWGIVPRAHQLSNYSAQKRTKQRLARTPFKVDIYKNGGFSSTAVDNCERTKTDICLDHSTVKGLKSQRGIFSPLL